MRINSAVILVSSLLFVACGSAHSGLPCDSPGGSVSKPEPKPEPVALSESFTEGGDADRDRFAIFVGIDSYPKIPGGDLDGCTNDVLKLKDLFAKHFKFKRSAIRTHAAATREGVKELFEGLSKQVTQAKEASVKDISVLLCCAGHGSQVKDQKEDGDENDGLDETWVTYDSSFEKGANDIRDDEILGDALLGTQATSRGDPLPAKAAPMKWATASLVVEIYDAKQVQGMLSEESPVTRHTVVALLGRMGKRAKAALPVLRRLAEKDPDAGVLKAAATAQKRVGG
jgi:hypothetical protein